MPEKRDRSNPTIPLLAVLAGLLLLSVSVVWVLQSSDRTSIDAPSSTPHTGEIPRVPLTQAVQAWNDGSAVFVDVRSAQSYAVAHIPDARTIPEDEITARLNELNQDDWIITYCT
jgi:3-mercaptopyruvate sulfurtransferase SseA